MLFFLFDYTICIVKIPINGNLLIYVTIIMFENRKAFNFRLGK